MSSEEELNKEQKLEAARKKFEELKKKKNSKKSKKSKKKKDESEEPEEESKSKENEVNDKEVTDETQKEPTVETEVVQNTDAISHRETEEVPKTEQEEPQSEITNESDDENANTEAAAASEEPAEGKHIDTNEPVTSDAVVTGLDESEQQASIEEEALESILESNTAGTSDFLSSTLQDQVKDLNKELEELRLQCQKLKEDNISLRLEKQDMELEFENKANELETANESIKKLQLDLKKLKLNSATASGLVSKTEDVKQQPLELDAPSSFQNLSSFNFSPTNLAVDEYMDIIDVKDRLAQWKGWNIDMRSWRSIGMGAVVDV